MNNKLHMCLRSTCQMNQTRMSCYTKYNLNDFLLLGHKIHLTLEKKDPSMQYLYVTKYNTCK